MNSDMKKSLMIVLIAGVASLLIGTVAFSFGLGEILSQNGILASFLGRTPPPLWHDTLPDCCTWNNCPGPQRAGNFPQFLQ